MIQVPQRGPGCQHFLTCAMCLTAPKFMGCGWCSGVCSWESECPSRWRNESCQPGITGVRFVFRNPGYTRLSVQRVKTFHFEVALLRALLYRHSSSRGPLLPTVKRSWRCAAGSSSPPWDPPSPPEPTRSDWDRLRALCFRSKAITHSEYPCRPRLRVQVRSVGEMLDFSLRNWECTKRPRLFCSGISSIETSVCGGKWDETLRGWHNLKCALICWSWW